MTKSPQTPRGFKTSEAARYLGVSPSWLRKLRMRGPDDPGTLGPKWRGRGDLIIYTREDLDAWIDSLDERPKGKSQPPNRATAA